LDLFVFGGYHFARWALGLRWWSYDSWGVVFAVFVAVVVDVVGLWILGNGRGFIFIVEWLSFVYA